MQPTSSGYADVNGIKLYHEIIGKFLADSLTGAAGAAAASQAALER